MDDSKLLREYVTLFLEKVRSSGFDWNVFKSLKTVKEVEGYASQHLQEIGKGSSRRVFQISGNKVLKVARTSNAKFGIAQNSQETEVANDPEVNFAVAKVFQHDPHHKWIVSEPVRTLTRMLEFHQLLGSEYNFFSFMAAAQRGDIDEMDEPAKKLATALQTMVDKHGLIWTDINNEDHWGKTADGRVVLLDSGWSEESERSF